MSPLSRLRREPSSALARRRTGPAAVALALSLALGACATNGAASGADDRTGCYQIERDAGARALGLPWGFELTSEPLEGYPNVPDGRVALTATGPETRVELPFNVWRPVGPDSVIVGAAPGGGFSLRLRVDGRDLVGTGAAVGDAAGFGPMADTAGRGPYPVVAREVLCGAR